jgi:hypothetical protein
MGGRGGGGEEEDDDDYDDSLVTGTDPMLMSPAISRDVGVLLYELQILS